MKTILLSLLIPLVAFVQPQPQIVVVELHNNCGKKIEINVALAHNEMNTSMDNGVRSKFKLKVGSDVRVNKNVVLRINATDNNKTLTLCK